MNTKMEEQRPPFEAIYQAVAELEFAYHERHSRFTKELQQEIAGLDPIGASDVVKSKLDQLHPNSELLELADVVREFQQTAVGEAISLDYSHSLVASVSSIYEKFAFLIADDNPLGEFLSKLKSAVIQRNRRDFLNAFLQQNAAAVQEHRMALLEGRSRTIAIDPKSHSEFTHTQQAIAIHFLLQEALGVSNVDTTRQMEFAHLLSAKRIPVDSKTGKENIRNSGIKSAFNKAWKKEDSNHLADLQFVLRFFKPLAVEGAAGMQQAVTALEKRITKLCQKLSRQSA